MDEKETRTVAVKVPTDLLKELTAFSERTKAASSDQAEITLRATPQHVELLSELRKDMTEFQKSRISEWHKLSDKIIKTTEMRISFCEKLILLAGGSFALSLTFVGYIHRTAQASPLAAVGRLKAAWILLLACIILSWLHNYYRNAVVDHLSAATLTNISAMQNAMSSDLLSRGGILISAMENPTAGLGGLLSVVSELLKSENKKSSSGIANLIESLKRYQTVAHVSGFLALLSIIIAFVLLVLFAMRNVAFL